MLVITYTLTLHTFFFPNKIVLECKKRIRIINTFTQSEVLKSVNGTGKDKRVV